MTSGERQSTDSREPGDPIGRTSATSTWDQERFFLLAFAVAVLAFACVAVFALVFNLVSGPATGTTASQNAGTIRGLCICVGISAPLGGLLLWGGLKGLREHKAYLHRLSAASLSGRAKRAAEALQEATRLVDDLKSELDARAILLEHLRRQAEAEQQRVADMTRLTQIDAATSGSVNRQIDDMLERRLSILERGARQREWLLATVVSGTVGLVVGVLAILLAQHLSL